MTYRTLPRISALQSSLRVKVTVAIVLPLLLILGVFSYVEYERNRATVLADLSLLASQSGFVIEDNLRQQMLKSDRKAIQSILDAIEKSETNTRAFVLDTNGEVIYAPGGDLVGVRFDNDQPACGPCHTLPKDERPDSVVVSNAEGQRVFRSMKAIENTADCIECHEEDGPLLGVLLTDIPTSVVEGPFQRNMRENILWAIGTIVVTVLVVNLVMSRMVLRRLEGLLTAITGFGQGQTTLRLRDEGPDEIGRLTDAFNVMTQSVDARQQENQALSERLHEQSTQRGELLRRLITAQEDERKRVARELHDELGQALSGLALRAQAIEQFIERDQSKAIDQSRFMRTMAEETTGKMYDLIMALRPSALDDLGLVPALRAHTESVLSDTGIQFELSAEGLRRRLPTAVETTMFRVTQEALTNILRHAKASRVSIRLSFEAETLVGEIADDGRGFEPAAVQANGDHRHGFGLLGMRERVEYCGGKMEIVSAPGQGATLRIQIPIEEGKHEPSN